ncbi:MAG TPA: adenylate/guanylate cyclase domain-containing protein [Candidatus Baltobacteraceae bacterium]|nr:adenylate/guanylate cyclase domain-containing protein [Candidatus Baltobacteraceae bacterium]
MSSTTDLPGGTAEENPNQELWYTIFAVGHPALKKFQRFHRLLPSSPRCRMCFAPFRGVGGAWMKLMHKDPCKRNPNFCNACDKFLNAFPGGAEVVMSIVFVDVRDSVKLAEKLGPTAWGRVINAFYKVVSDIFYRTDGFVMDLIGDEVVAFYPPGFSGPDHAKKAIRAAQEILAAEMPKLPDGTELAVGVGVNTGPSYIGSTVAVPYGQDDVRAFGDSMNTTSRLASAAGPCEALIAEVTWSEADMDKTECEERQVVAKGKEQPIPAHVLH